MIDMSPFHGQTYTLTDAAGTSDALYRELDDAVEGCLRWEPDPHALLALVERLGRRRSDLRRLTGPRGDALARRLMELARDAFSPRTTGHAAHMAALPVTSRFDRILTMTEEQHQLGLLEVGLSNRVNAAGFHGAAFRFALLPICLHDLARECRSRSDGVEHLCIRCSATCELRAMSDVLRTCEVLPYVWRRSSLRSNLRRLTAIHGSVAVVGVACIPELLHGMRRCRAAGVPVLGVPLDANRCARWMGDFHPNQVNLGALRCTVTRNDGRPVTPARDEM